MCDITTTRMVGHTPHAGAACRGRDRYTLELVAFNEAGVEVATSARLTTCSNHLQVGAQTIETKRQELPNPALGEIVLTVIPHDAAA